MKPTSKHLIVIAGPTAVGKTAMAIELAKRYCTVIISADSRQFYRQLNIGTAKPSDLELKEVEHYLINNKNLDELYGAGHFASDANKIIDELFKSYDVLILVGGSGLYINALLNGIDEFEAVPLEIRNKLNTEYEQLGLTWLQNELQMVDPEYHKKVDLNNSQRIIRAIEVYRHTGSPYSSFLQKKENKQKFGAIKLLINTDRNNLYRQINQRVDKMIESGLLEEVRSLLPYRNMNALNTVGYKELIDYLDGNCSLEFAIDKIKQHTRNYAKRQLTWFKNQNNFEIFEPNDIDKICNYINQIIANEQTY